MSYWKHLNENQRKLISNMLSKKMKLAEMAGFFEIDSSSISKEIKRNQLLSKIGTVCDNFCK